MFSTEEGTKLTFTEVQTSSWQGKMRPVFVRRNGGGADTGSSTVVDGNQKSGVYQLRLVVYFIIYSFFLTFQVVQDIIHQQYGIGADFVWLFDLGTE